MPVPVRGDERRARIEEALTSFLSREAGYHGAVVEHLARIRSVGNAREPWAAHVRRTAADGTAIHEQSVVLVAPSGGQIDTVPGHTFEFQLLASLYAQGVRCPRPLWNDADGLVFGRPAFATARVEGTSDYGLLTGALEAEASRTVLLDLAQALGELHLLDPLNLTLPVGITVPDLPDVLAFQLDVWDETFQRHRLEPAPLLVRAFDWLRDNAPNIDRRCLVHGDLRVGNFLHAHGHVTALLDWELAHVGDRHEDLAWLYREMWSPAGILDEAAFIEAYEAGSGLRVDPDVLRWQKAFNEVKHSVISITAADAVLSGRSANLRMLDRASWVTPFLQRFAQLVAQQSYESRHPDDPDQCDAAATTE